MVPYIVEPLSREKIRTVYPLMREAIPGLTLIAWLRFARAATGRRGKPRAGSVAAGRAGIDAAGRAGIIVARREGQSFPVGLFCYHVERDPAMEKVLIAEHFVAVDLLHPADVLTALASELETLGQRLGCDAVRSIVRRPDVIGSLNLAGHAMEGSLLGKSLTRYNGPAA